MHWSNNGHVTHVDNDYLQCDLWDFPERRIAHREIKSFSFQERRPTVGILFPLAAILLGVIVWLLANILSTGKPITLSCGSSFALISLLLVSYLSQRTWHLVRNKRRALSLELSDGSSGTFIEMEDDRKFQQLRECLERNRPSQ